MDFEATLLAPVFRRAKENPQRIAFPEAFDATMLAAAYEIAAEGMGFPVLVGNTSELQVFCVEQGYDPAMFQYVDLGNSAYMDELVERFSVDETKKWRGAELREKMSDPLIVSMVMQALGEVICVAAGYIASTASVIRAALRIIGVDDGGFGTSAGLIEVPARDGHPGQLLIISDIGIVPNPNAEQLATIAIHSCDTARVIFGEEPMCAMLSYSTKGSAKGPEVDKVIEATRIANERRPDLKIDGEYQLDAAVNPIVGAKKAGADNPVAGKANVLIFPDLNAGNIAQKIFTEFAGAWFYGLIMQGFKQVCSDNSRGSTTYQLIGNIIVSAMLALEKEGTNHGE